MTFVDACLFAVPTENREAYLESAKAMSVLFREHGALDVNECWGADIPEGKVNSLHTAVLRKPEESIVFSWISWPDKATRDAAWEKVMSDPRMGDMEKDLFDGSRMIFGGFEKILEA